MHPLNNLNYIFHNDRELPASRRYHSVQGDSSSNFLIDAPCKRASPIRSTNMTTITTTSTLATPSDARLYLAVPSRPRPLGLDFPDLGRLEDHCGLDG
jgi:hypothetical protein